MPIILKGTIYSIGNKVFFRGTDEKGKEYNIIPLENLVYMKGRTFNGFFSSQEAVSIVISLEKKK